MIHLTFIWLLELCNGLFIMRIGFFLESAITTGGAFQQTLSAIQAISRSLPSIDLIVMTNTKANLEALQRIGVCAQLFQAGRVTRFLDSISSLMPRLYVILQIVRRLGWSKFGRNLDCRLAELGIDVAVFNSRSATALRLSEHPYVLTIWDLCHRDFPEFPEVSHSREFERREQLLKSILPKALAVIVNSPSGVEDIVNLYQVSRERVVLIPFLPSIGVRKYAEGLGSINIEQAKDRYGIKGDYVFYPAQLWPHKNHVYVLDALFLLKKKYGVKLSAVFSGSDNGGKRHVLKISEDLGILDQVFFLGFVPDEYIPPLYEGAVALVFPTYFGPTNLPPLEAALLGCPVIYSDIPEFRDQMGGAALYCDLREPCIMAEHLHALIKDADLRERLVMEGKKHVASLDEGFYYGQLDAVLKDYEYKMRRWKI